MIRNLTIITLAVLLTAGVAVAQFAENVLPNGDFEDGLTGWSPSISDAKKLGTTVTLDPAQAKHGAQALKLNLPGGPSGAMVGSPLAPVQGGQWYLVSFSFRSEGFSDSDLYAGVNLQYTLAWLDADKKQVGGGGSGLSYGAVPTWRFRSALFRAPEKAAFLAISFNMSCDDKGRASSAWFDRVQVRPWLEIDKPDAKKWVYPVYEDIFDKTLFRKVADDDTPSGFAVLANPKFVTKPGYLMGGLYLRTLPAGAYRFTFRLKLGELPAEPKNLLTWDLNSGIYGTLNSGVFSTAAFQKAGVYHDFTVRCVNPPAIPGKDPYVDPRVYWAGGIATWIDTVTVTEEKTFTAEDLKALME